MRRYTVKVNDKEKVIDVEAVGANLFRVKVDGRLVNVTLEDHRDLAHTSPSPPASRLVAQTSRPRRPRSVRPLEPMRPGPRRSRATRSGTN